MRRPGTVRRQALGVGSALVLTLAMIGCGTAGTDLREPPAGMTAPAPTSTTTSTTAAPVFSVFSPAFPMAGEIPDSYTCAGEGISPPVNWVGAPVAATELALTVTTPGIDAGDEPTVHWILTGMPADTPSVPEGAIPDGAMEGPNSEGGTGWSPPCVEGDAISQLQFQLHALETASAVEADMSASEALAHLLALPGTRTISSGTVVAGG